LLKRKEEFASHLRSITRYLRSTKGGNVAKGSLAYLSLY